MPDFLTNLSQRILGTAPAVRPSFPSLFAPQRRAEEERFAGSEPDASFFAADDGGLHSTADVNGMEGSAVEGRHREKDDLRSAAPAGPSASSPGVFPEAADTPSSGAPLSVSPRLLPPLDSLEGERPERSSGLPVSDPFAFESSSHPFENEGKEATAPTGTFSAAEGRESEENGRREEGRTDGKPGATGAEARNAGRMPEEWRGEREMMKRPLLPATDRTDERSRRGEREIADPAGGGAAARRMEGRSDRAERMKEGRGEEENRRPSTVEYARPVRESFDYDAFPDRPNEERGGEERRESRGEFGAEAERGSGNPRRNERTLLVPGHRPDPSREERMPAPSAPAEASRDEGVSSRTVNVTIGRIEVRGTPQRTAPPVPARQPSPAPERSAAISLTEYLKRYNGRGG